jgi:hypothetical protein
VFLQNTKSSTGDSTYTTLRSPAEMLEELKKAVGEEHARAILDGKRNVVASCGSGMTAGVLWLGLNILGVRNVGIYDEVMTLYSLFSNKSLTSNSELDRLRHETRKQNTEILTTLRVCTSYRNVSNSMSSKIQ